MKILFLTYNFGTFVKENTGLAEVNEFCSKWWRHTNCGRLSRSGKEEHYSDFVVKGLKCNTTVATSAHIQVQ